MEKIGLFPLGIVMFPEAVIPLHIYEERYKLLIKNCWEQKKPFGISLIDSSKIYNIGCVCEVIDIFKISEDGKMDIIVKGLWRYQLNSFTDGEQPYYIGNVTQLNDIEEKTDEALLIECLTKFNEIVDNLHDVRIEAIDIMKLKSNIPSYIIASKAGLSVNQKQEILEKRNENERLNLILIHLKRVLPMVKEAEIISKIIRNDGYYFPGMKD
ncbi:MAG: LON peptidase substrate-binding domain-containing protein [Candidatus Kapabacteria bacterium]|nr:LON peptidase substrate-binding domain-containing protein [Candidatus Kapabacteria bacterium]